MLESQNKTIYDRSSLAVNPPPFNKGGKDEVRGEGIVRILGRLGRGEGMLLQSLRLDGKKFAT